MKLRLLSAAAILAMAGGANAADLPSRAPVAYASPAPLFTWTGFYVGLNAGYAFGNSGKTRTIGTPGFVGLGPTIIPLSLNTGKSSFVGGVQAGYNQQFGSFVAGIEADVDYMQQKRSASFTGAAVLGTQLTTSATRDVNYLATLRARFGVTPIDRMLLYVTGGLAFGGVKSSGSVVGVQAPALVWAGSKNSTRVGYAIGAGAEYAVTNNVTVKGEYLYYNLGRQSFAARGNAAVRVVAALNGIDYLGRSTASGSIVRVGLNYKF